MRWRCLLVPTALVILLLPSVPRAQEPPSFDELIADAGSIVLTEVLDTRSEWRSLSGKRVIVTEVRFRVEREVKGREHPIVSVTFLGGMVGDVTQHVAGTPRFLVGDRDVLFLARERTLVAPLVDRAHGRFRIVTGHDGSGQFVTNSALQPLVDTARYRQPPKLAAAQRALSLEQFLEAVGARVKR